MITKEIAVNAASGTTFYHKTLKNADGTPLRARVNGKCKTLKRTPDYFRLPMKHGLRNCFYIEPGYNDQDFLTSEQVAYLAWRSKAARV